MALNPAQRDWLRTKHVFLVSLYFVAVIISTVFGVAPVASLFGSFENQMGLITRLCFLIFFLSLIAGIGNSQARFRQTVWAMTITGLAVAIYAFMQFFGKDFFLSPALYTFDSVAGPVVRVIGTLGHADYLGNFLLYTTLPSIALALATRDRVRMLALIATAVSIAAIIFSGTRGAALGLTAGAVVFSALQFRTARISFNRRTLGRAAVAAAIILGSILLISLNPASRSITARAVSAIKEGRTGAGRTVLWRDAAKMIPAFAITGCGPEGFRKAFLAYKSKEIAQLAPGTNDENAHNSYLDAAISYGLPGAICYVAIIASSFSLLMRARRSAGNPETKIIITGLLSSLVAVAVHNFFIFDQIPTGLYFFALVALAQSALSVATPDTRNSKVKLSPGWPGRAIIVVGVAFVGAAVWYATALAKADFEIKKSFASAGAVDYEATVKHGERAARSLEPTGAYRFQYARALTFYADLAGTADAGKRASSINMAITQIRESLPHTLTPDASYILLSYLALRSGNAAELRTWATEAVNCDPYYSNAHWLMAESYLAEGNLEEAKREARIALEINPNSKEAVSALKRSRGVKETARQTVEELLNRGQDDADQGRMKKAQKKITHALRKARGQCAECHRALAAIYETTRQYDKALAEWSSFLEQTSDRAAREKAQSRIESLKQKKP
ncbi:MAG: O-antigen ligase family protein [Blastocatellia bacterium]